VMDKLRRGGVRVADDPEQAAPSSRKRKTWGSVS